MNRKKVELPNFIVPMYFPGGAPKGLKGRDERGCFMPKKAWVWKYENGDTSSIHFEFASDEGTYLAKFGECVTASNWFGYLATCRVNPGLA